MSEKNKAVVRRVYEEGWNQEKYEVLDECLSPDYVDHEGPPGMNKGIEATKKMFQMYNTVIGQDHWHIENMVAEGDKVVVQVTMKGIQIGEFLGTKPTNKPVQIRGFDMFRVVDGKITDHWGAANMWDLSTILAGKSFD